MSKLGCSNVVGSANFFERLFLPSNALSVFAFALLIVYGLVPFTISFFVLDGEIFRQLAFITTLSVVAMYLGSRLRFFDYRFQARALRLNLKSEPFIAVTWLIFGIFLVVTFVSAPSIPFLSALSGADGAQLSQERGDFLKGREGSEIILLYLSTFLVNTIVPYSVVLLYARKSPSRHFAAVTFFIFCISFMQKSLFLSIVLPIIAFMAMIRCLRGRVFIGFIFGSLLILVATTFLSLRGEHVDDKQGGEYLTALYAPSSSFDYFVWRSVAVPIFTATDTLVVHQYQFGKKLLMGATSSFISATFGMERINMERFVFEHQFGSWNEIANSNAVFVVDAFINFGWMGVFIFGLIVGQVFRWFRISQDVAFQSLWPLFAFILFSSPLIGMLLSNGWLYILFHALFIRVKSEVKVNY
jgi:hypothetical protein